MKQDIIRILYIDDNSFDRELVRDALEKEQSGFQLTLTKSQDEFEEELNKGDFDIVLSDFNIAGFEGLDVIDIVQKVNPNLPVIIVTGTGSEEIVVEALKKGAAEYVIKTPEHIRRLDFTIQQVIDRQKFSKERAEAREALQRSEERYRSLFNSAMDGIALVEAESGCIADCNPTFEKLIDRQKEELSSMKFGELQPDFLKDSNQTGIIEFDEYDDGNPIEKSFERKDGKVIPVECVATKVVILDHSYIQIIVRDITERKKAEEKLKAYSGQLEERVKERTKELQEAQQMLLYQERMSTLGQLGRGMAHELRTPLGSIKNAAYFLDMVLETKDEDIKEALNILNKEVGTSELIINSLLEYASPSEAVQRKIEVHDILQSVLHRLQIPDAIEVIEDFDDDNPYVWVDPEQFQRILRNLIRNALQSMPDGGSLTLRTRGITGDRMEFSIIDTGCGIEEENLGEIFEPLFTTRARGMGLGLPLAEMYVKMNKGSIEVESEADSGSLFKIILSTVDIS